MYITRNYLMNIFHTDDKKRLRNELNKEVIRDSNIELLRIFSMILIVAHHFSLHGVLKEFSENPLVNQSVVSFLAQVIQLGGKAGVTLFIIISGYFMVQTNVKIKKLFLLLFQVLFYSIFGFTFVTVLGKSIGLSSIINAFFPVIHDQYWFITAYIVLYLISPYLNKLLLILTEKEYLNMLGIMIFLWIVIPSFTRGQMGSSNITRFILFYSIGSFLRLYPTKKFNNKKLGFYLFIVSYFMMLVSVMSLNFIGKQLGNGYLIKKATYFSDSSSILTLIVSIGLFIWIKNIHIGSRSWINKISGAMLGVYLIHDNKNIRPILWHKIFHTGDRIQNTPIEFIGYAILVIFVVFIVSVVIELLRKKLFNIIIKSTNFFQKN